MSTIIENHTGPSTKLRMTRIIHDEKTRKLLQGFAMMVDQTAPRQTKGNKKTKPREVLFLDECIADTMNTSPMYPQSPHKPVQYP